MMLCENIKNANDRKIVMFYLICILYDNILIYKTLFMEYSNVFFKKNNTV